MQMFSDEVLEKMAEILKNETIAAYSDHSESSIIGDQYFYAWNKLREWLEGLDDSK